MSDDSPRDELTADIKAIDNRPVVVLKIAGSGLDGERSQHVPAFSTNVLWRPIRADRGCFSSCEISLGRVALNLTHAFRRGLSDHRCDGLGGFTTSWAS